MTQDPELHGDTTQALVCESPGVLRLTRRPTPVPSSSEVLVRVRRVGVCGTDLHAFAGDQPFLEYPRVLGHELAGEIVAIPEESFARAPGLGAPTDHELSVGDQVVVIPYIECGACIACRAGRPNCCVELSVLGVHVDGGMQEFLAVPATHVLPARGLSLDQAALVECLSIGAHAVRRAAVTRGEAVVVAGAGPIGLGVVLFARAAGARVFVVDRDEARLRFVADTLAPAQNPSRNPAQNPVKVIDGRDPAAARAAIQAATGGEFAPAVFDVTGNRESMEHAVELLSHGGRLVFVGLIRGEFAIDHPAFHKREAALLSSRNATREDFVAVMNAMREGEIDTGPWVSKVVSLAAAVEGFPSWSGPGSGRIKTWIEM